MDPVSRYDAGVFIHFDSETFVARTVEGPTHTSSRFSTLNPG